MSSTKRTPAHQAYNLPDTTAATAAMAAEAATEVAEAATGAATAATAAAAATAAEAAEAAGGGGGALADGAIDIARVATARLGNCLARGQLQPSPSGRPWRAWVCPGTKKGCDLTNAHHQEEAPQGGLTGLLRFLGGEPVMVGKNPIIII